MQKGSLDNIIKHIANLFKSEERNKVIEEKIIGDIKKLFEQEKDYYKQVRVGNFQNNLSINEYCDKVKLYFKKCYN